jgi:hypothetical protein
VYKFIALFFLLIACSRSDIITNKIDDIKVNSVKSDSKAPRVSNCSASNAKNPIDKMVEVIDFGVVRSCTCHKPTENQIVEAVRRSVSEKDIPNDVLVEYIDDFFEIRHKIYNMIGFAYQLEFAKRAYAEKINENIILDCVNNNLFLSDSSAKIISNFMTDPNYPTSETILSVGCGSPWKDYAKYNFVRHKLFGEKRSDIMCKYVLPKRCERYQRIMEKVYDFSGDSHALNCKYQIARNFLRHGIDKKVICKICSFSDDEFEDFVRPVY